MKKTFLVVGMVILWAFVGAMVLMMIWSHPSILRTGPRRRPTDRGNLRNIGIALSMYRSVHEEPYPPGLHTLVEEGFLQGQESLVSPNDPDPPRIGPQGYPCSYEYPGPLPADVPPDFVVAYTRRGVLSEGRNVLFADGAVVYVPESDIARGETGRVSLQDAYNWLMERKEDLPEDADLDRIADFYGVPRP